MSRRKREPDARALLRFIADHESLALTTDEFPDVGEERIRELLRSLADEHEAATSRPAQVAARRPAQLELGAAAPVVAEPPAPPPRGSAKRVVLHTDGASRGNPGPAGAGWILSSPEGEVLRRGAAFLGRRTNNEAEYEAVIRGLTMAIEGGYHEVALRSDSELLIKQINGEYQVRNERLALLHDKVRSLMRRLKRVDARHVRREHNTLADAAANEAIDRSHSARA